MSKAPLTPLEQVLSQTTPVEIPEIQTESGEYGQRQPSVDSQQTYSAPQDMLPLFEQAANKYQVPVNVLLALADQESSFNPRAVGPQTKWGQAKGLMQYLDTTAQRLGINPYDPAQSVEAAAMQLRERLDKGYAMEDAVKEHFAGPDRRQWGPKTARYGLEVIGKANGYADYYESLYAQQAQQAEPKAEQSAGDRLMEAATQDQFKAAQDNLRQQPASPLTIENQQRAEQQASAQQPPSPLTPTNQERVKAGFGIRPDMPKDGFVDATSKTIGNIPERFQNSAGGAMRYLGEDMGAEKERSMQITAQRLGITPDDAKLVYWAESNGLIGDELKQGSTQDMVNALRQQYTLDGNPDQQKAVQQAFEQGGIFSPTELAKYGAGVSKAAKADMVEVNPDGPLAKYGSMIIGSTAEMVPAIVAGMVTRSPNVSLAMIGGQVYGDSYDRARTDEKNAMEPRQAAQYALAQSAAEAIPSALPVGVILKEGGKFFTGILKAGAAEAVQEGLTGALQAAIDKGTITPDMTWAQAREQIVDSMIVGAGAGASIKAGVDGTRAAGQAVSDYRQSRQPQPQERVEPTVSEDVAADQPAPQNDLAGMDTSGNGLIQEAPVGPPKPLMVDQVKPAPSGPLGRAMQNAMQGRADESAADTQRVTLSAEGLDPIGGVVISESAEAVTIRGDDGQKYEIPREDIASGMAMIQPEGMEQAAPVERPAEQQPAAEVEQQPVADQAEQAPAVAEPVAEVVQESVNAPKRDDEEKKAQSYDEMDEPQLRDRLKYLAGQAKATGGWNKTLMQERAKVEKAISKIVSQPDAKKDAEWAKEMADAAPTFEEKAQFFDRQQDIEAKQKSADQATVSPETVTAPAPAEASNQMAVKDEKAAVEPSAPAPAAADQTAVKWFGSEAKALGYIQGKGIGDTHEVVLEGKRYEIREKADPEGWEAVPGFSDRSRKEVMEAVTDMRKYNEGLEFRTRTVDGKLVIEKRPAVVNQQLTTEPAVEESLTVAPTNRTQAAEAGAKAFAAGEKRVPPAMKPGLQEAWLKAWDKANLAAPAVAEAQTPKVDRQQAITEAQGAAAEVLSQGGTEADANRAATDLLIERMADDQSISIANDAPAAVQAAKQNKPDSRKERAEQLVGKVGDTVTPSKAFDYLTAGKPMVVESIDSKGGVYLRDPVTGSGTQINSLIAERQGVTFAKQEKASEQPAPTPAPAEKIPAPAWWENSTPAERHFRMRASGVKGTAQTPWNRLNAADQRALNEQWGDRAEQKPAATKKVSEGVTATVIDPSAGREATPAMKWVQSSTEERKATLKAAGYTDGDQARAYAGSEWADLPSTVREKIEGKQPEQSAMRQTVPVEDGRKVQKLRDMRELGRKAGEAGEERTAPEWSANSDLEDAWLEGYGQGMATRVQRAINASQVTPDLSDMTEPSITRRANPGNMSDRSFVARAFLVDGDVPVMGVGETSAEALAELRKDADRKKAEAKPAESDLDAMFDDVLAEVTGEQATKAAAEPAAQADDATVESLEDELRAQKKRVARLKGGDATKLKAAETRLRRMRTGILQAEDTLAPAARAGDAEALAKLEEMGFADTADAIRAFLPEEQRSAGKALASAAKNTASALDEAINGLGALFGGNGKLSSGLTFDEETYAKAKPLFISAVANLRAASQDLRQAMQAVVKMVVDRFGADTAKNMKPYVVRFIEDVRDGKVQLGVEDDAGRNAASDDQPLADVPPLGSYEAGQGTAETSEGLRAADAEGNGQLEDDRAGRGNSLDGSQEPVLSGATPEAGRVAEGPLNRREDVPNKLAGENPGNFVITEDFGLGQGTAGQKINANLEAIRTLRKVQAEGRFPTREEQSVMARYVGWGGLKSVFDVKKADATDVYGRAQRELKELLSADEYSAAFDSVRNAHYTAKGVVDAMWRMARHMGFDGGRVLEPTVGIGNFIGLQPADLAASSEWHASELDSVTGHMAKMLYPEANVLAATGFQAAPFADNVFDLAIGNPPFGAAQIVDRSPARKHLNRMKVHNYIIAKTGMHLRPGGVMAMVVTHRFLDTANPEARDVLAKDFKFLGAIRLPNDAFAENANTEVTTDIVFLQKLREGEKPEANPAWLDVAGSIEVDGETIGVNRYFQEHPNHILGRSAMDGTMYAGRRDAEGKGEYTVHSDGRDLGKAIDDLIAGDFADLAGIMAQTKQDANVAAVAMLQQSDIPVGGMRLSEDGKILRRDMDDEAGNAVVEEITADSLWKDQAAEYMAVRDAMVELRDASQQRKLIPEDFNELLEMARFAYKADGTPKSSPTKAEQAIYDMVDAAQKPEAFEWTYGDQLRSINEALARKQLGQESYDALKGMLDLRNRTLDLIHAEMADAKDMEAKRADLNKAYDAFVKKHGFVSDPSNANLLGGDIGAEAGLEASFEPAISKAVSKSTGVPARQASAKKSDILSKRVNFPDKEITSADNPSDALDISLSERGKVDLAYMAKLLGQDVQSVIGALTTGENPRLFVDPESGDYVDADEYLSGNVKHKLQAAKRAGLKANIKALEQVQPAPKTKSQIKPSIRGMWMPDTAFTDFLRAIGVRSPSIMAIPGQGILRAEGSVGELTEFGAQFKHEDRSVIDIFNAAASGKSITIMRRMSNGESYKDEAATKEVNALVERMSKVFNDFAYADDARAESIVEAFNEKMNTHAPRKYDGKKYMRLVGANPSIVPRRTQLDAAWRMIQSITMLADHVVGAGKTFTAIMGVKERRRLGLSRKPMIAVPNHLVVQWARDFYKMYPGAKVLAATPADFAKKNRRRLFARIATGDYDAVIVGHTSLGFIENLQDDQKAIIDENIRSLEEAMEQAREAKESGRTLTQMRDRLEKYKDKLQALGERSVDEIGIDFKKLGIDYLVVDEAHEFKNLEYATSGERVVGMNDPSGSKRAFDLYVKVRGLLGRKGGVAFLTGTPVSNSLVELYTMMRYLAHDELKLRDQDHFDAWSGAYAATETKLEYTATQKLKPRRVLAGLNNLSALNQLYKQFADTITMTDLKRIYAEEVAERNDAKGTNDRTDFPIPKVKGGKRQLDTGEITEAQREYMDYLVARMGIIESKKGQEGRDYARIDNPLNVLTDARKMSLDIRVVDPTLPRDENGKVMRAARRITSIYNKWADVRGTQMVFCDLSTPAKNAAKDAKVLIKDAAEKLFGESQAKQVRRQLDGKTYQQQWAWLKEKAEELIDNPELSQEKRDEIESYMAEQEDADAVVLTADIGFSVYDDLKAVLVEQGIPESEIAFIHDYNTPEQKEKLFDRMNNGYVRVLIGSSPKMGAGTNAQKRLVALHHMDAPWRPSDVEQREGRIIRQGNLFYQAIDEQRDGDLPPDILAAAERLRKENPNGFEVDITAYSTAGTSDTVMWQVLERKSAGIEQFRTGDLDEMQEGSSDSNQYAEFMATSTGNPVFRLKLEAERAYTELEAEVGGKRIAKANADVFLRDFDGRRKDHQDMVDGLSAATVSEASYKGESGTAAEFEKAMGAAQAEYDAKYAEYLTKRGEAEAAIYAWEKQPEQSRGKKPAMPTAPTRPSILTKEVQASSGYARAAAALLDAGKVDGRVTMSIGDGASLFITGRESFDGKTNYWDLYLEAANGQYIKIADGSGATARASTSIVRALEPSAIKQARDNEIANAKSRVANLESRKHAQEKLATLEIDESKVSEAKSLMDWYKMQVSFAEVQADIDRSARPNRFIPRDYRRFGASQERKKVAAAAPETITFEGVDYNTTGISVGHFAGRYLQAARASDGKPVFIYQLVTDKGAYETRQVVEQPKSAAEVKASIGERFSSQSKATADSVTRAITSGRAGRLVKQLLDAGKIVVHDRMDTVPGETVAGMMAKTEEDGTIHMVAENLSNRGATAVLLHEMFHAGARPLVGTRKWAQIMVRLERLYKQYQASQGKAGDFFQASQKRVESARQRMEAAGKPISDLLQVEEFGAYAIEEYERAPLTMRKLVDDMLGLIKDFLFRRFGVQLGQVTPAQLGAMARAALRSQAPRPGPNGGNRYSTTEQTETQAFRRWFGDSKVVGADGKPLVVYHGTDAEFSEFSDYKPNFFTASADYANGYGETLMPVYLRIEKPFDTATDQEARRIYNDEFRNDPLGRDAPAIIEGQSVPFTWADELFGFLYEREFTAKQRKYDGLIVAEKAGGNFGAEGEIAFVPLENTQIKSAIGNRGTFDPSNPDIRYSQQSELQRALAMTEDEYIAAVNPTGETSDEDGSARLVRGDLTDPENATVVRKLADGITIERDAEGNFFARQGGDTIAEIINYGDEVNVNVLPETRGKGVALALGMEFMRVNPFFQAGSLTQGGEAVVRAAWRRLKAEQGERYSLSEVPNDAPTGKEVDSWFSQKLTDAMTGPSSKGAATILAAAPMDRIVEELATNSPAAQEFLKLNRDMAAYRNKKYVKYDETAQSWMKLNWRNRKAAAAMADIMHEATIAQTDPAAPFESSITKLDTQLAAYDSGSDAGKAAIAKIAEDRKRREAHAELKARYDALPKAYRDLYVTVRDQYKGLAQELDEILAANLGMALDIGARKAERRYDKDMEAIRDEGLQGDERKEAEGQALKRFNAATTKQRWNKRARMTELRQQLEANRLKGPYFPLARFGEYFVTVRDQETGEVISFNLFKTSREQQQFAKEARSMGQVTTGLLSNKDEVRGAVDPRFVTEVEEILAGADVPDGVKDQVWQRYLESMPELSMRKGFIHRKGRKGYSSDALRAFASRMFHGSYQMGRLKYGAQMQEQLELAQEQAAKSETPERDTAVINELNRRFKFVMNPTGTALAQRLTSAAFVWQLSMSPAAALVNLSQTVIMGMPILSADLNVNMAKTGAELTKALKDYGTGLGHAAKSKALSDDERAAMKAGYDSGLIEATQTYDLAGVGDTGVEYNPVRNKVMGAVGWMFHQAERLNREVTYLAAYRMARQKGQDHERAIETASRLTYKTHFDYSAANRPRVMQNDFAKVALVFRNYSVNMLFRLFRDVHQVVAGDRQARNVALKQLAGITGMMAASAGVRGVWLYGVAMVLAGMLFGDDAEEKFKKGTIELLGPTMAGYVLNGLPGHALDASLSERIGMPDLWFRSPDRQLEGKDEFNYWFMQAAGAFPSLLGNVWTGFDMIFDGHVFRGVETASPKFVKDLMRAGRFAYEGATTMRGDKLVEEFTAKEIITQALGFTPAVVAEQYERNSALMNAQQRIRDERSQLMKGLIDANQRGNEAKAEELIGKIQAFNEENPEVPITFDSLRRSAESRARYTGRAEGGVALDRRLDARLRDSIGDAIYK